MIFDTKQLNEYLSPIVYQVKLGEDVLYIGASAHGLGRPLSRNHVLFELVKEFGQQVQLEVETFPTANEAFEEEIRLIAGLRPRFNMKPSLERRRMMEAMRDGPRT